MPRIKQVSMQNFRGSAASSVLRFGNKPLILIFGENGSGKSTVVDAIDLVCNDRYGTIDERSSATRKDHLPTIGSSTAQVEVRIEFDAGTWTGTLNTAGKALIHPAHSRPAVEVLRRRSLLKLTEDTPGERYKQLQSLIDVGQVERAEQQLKQAAEQVGKRLDDAARDIRNAENIIDRIWETEGKPMPTAVSWAQTRTTSNQDTLRAQVGILEQEIGGLIALRDAAQDYKDADAEQQKAQDTLALLDEQLTQQGQILSAALAALLQDTQQYLTPTEIPIHENACPVCQKTVNLTALRAQLGERLEASQHLNTLNSHRQQAQLALITAAHDLNRTRHLLTTAQAKAGTLSTIPKALHSKQVHLATLRNMLENHTALSQALSTLGDARTQAQQHEATAQRLSAMRETLRTTRLTYTQSIFNQVSTEAQRLYQIIHPSEPLGLSALELDPKKTASLHQKGVFHGHHDIAPQGFYSEAHLDTLGFCFWLAVIKHTTPQAIVVLDDVFTSVDAAHLNRIDELLLAEATSGAVAQIVVITHYRGWLDKLKGSMPNDIEVKELLKWSLAHGIRVHNALPNIVALKNKLEETYFDRQGVASRAGVVLEAVLDEMTIVLELELKRNPKGIYTLEPLLKKSTAAAKQFHSVYPDDPVPHPWAPTFARLNALAFIRNQVGAHFNLDGSDVADDDIREFAEATVKLTELLTCPICNNRNYLKDHGTHRSCKACGRTKVTPNMPTI